MLDPARLVFIDETAVTTNMVRAWGRSPRGVELIGRLPQGHWQTLTFVAGLRHDKMVAPMVFEGAMNAEMFLAYVEQCLVPTLRRGDIVIIDNVNIHKAPLSATRSRMCGRRFATCQNTRLTLIRLSCRSAGSRHSCANSPSEPLRVCAGPLVRSSSGSPPANVPTTSGMPATLQHDRETL